MTAVPTNPMMIVPTPPSQLKCNVLLLHAGAVVHRIHDKGLQAEQFNPGTRGNSRFAPITTPDGSRILTSYAATTFACAAFETIFHDIDPDAPFKSVPWTTIERLSYSTLEFGRDVRLCKMFSPDLMKWNCAR
ncbi:MAG: RES domain-containing protein, partial [Methylocystis sp.]